MRRRCPGSGARSSSDLEIPRRFSVTGLVARHWAEQFHPRLTAFDVPASELAATAVRFLRERIAKPGTAPAQRLLLPEISPGESTGPAVARP